MARAAGDVRTFLLYIVAALPQIELVVARTTGLLMVAIGILDSDEVSELGFPITSTP